MSNIESIHRTLSIVSALLDNTAGLIRDEKLEPVFEHIGCIGNALAQISEVQRAIYALQPELTPDHLRSQSDNPISNKRLTEYMYQASELERNGHVAQAIGKYAEFLAIEKSSLHRSIAEDEIKRLSSQ